MFHLMCRADKAGVVWGNCTNLFEQDASGCGGYRESG